MQRTVITILTLLLVLSSLTAAAAADITCWFPPAWSERSEQATAIVRALSRDTGITIRARVAASYSDILTAFATDDQHLVYAGSFVQSILAARRLGYPLLQNIDGREMYAGIMITRKGDDPSTILKSSPQRIAYTRGASSGEASAKAATDGQAQLATDSHRAAIAALAQGKAVAAFVKDWWWEEHRRNFPELDQHRIPGVSIQLNPDNVLSASRTVPAGVRREIKLAAMRHSQLFGAGSDLQTFAPGRLAFTLGLMRKGGIDPLSYSW